jgi:hypothetical protein
MVMTKMPSSSTTRIPNSGSLTEAPFELHHPDVWSHR